MQNLARAWCGLMCACFLVTSGVAAGHAGEITRCDIAASNPPDPDRVAPGVERHDIELPGALAACKQAVQDHPDDPRQRYQLARILFYAGESKQALTEMRRAADMDYRQAQFLYGLLIVNGSESAPDDICVAEQYWRMSARAGRHAAITNYAIYLHRGAFDACESPVETREVMAWLQLMKSGAPAATPGYYQRLLAEDLADRIASRP